MDIGVRLQKEVLRCLRVERSVQRASPREICDSRRIGPVSKLCIRAHKA